MAKKRAKQEKQEKKAKQAKQAKKVKQASAATEAPFSEALRFAAGDSLASLDTRATPAFEGDKVAGKAAADALDAELGELQERLFAQATAGGRKRLLLVVQGMDTAGKGGIMRHVIGAVDPQGVRITAFKAPTAAERAEPFLARIRRALPSPGQIGVFDRSHYEDVLIVRVHDLVPRRVWSRRYATIRRFEQGLLADDVHVVKVMLHLGKDEQKARLTERLERPDKHWKYNPGDVDERGHWDAYQEAYQVMLDKTSTGEAPWFVVPADRKWYARLAVKSLVLEALRAMDPQWPATDVDVAAELERLRATRGGLTPRRACPAGR